MKISNAEVGRIIESRRTTPVSSGSSAAHTPIAVTPAPTAASVEISAKALEIQRVKRAVDALPDVRQEQIDAIKARIDAGTYSVSPDDVADLMVRRAYADSIR